MNLFFIKTKKYIVSILVKAYEFDNPDIKEIFSIIKKLSWRLSKSIVSQLYVQMYIKF